MNSPLLTELSTIISCQNPQNRGFSVCTQTKLTNYGSESYDTKKNRQEHSVLEIFSRLLQHDLGTEKLFFAVLPVAGIVSLD